jgi:hypothetical protein
MRHTRLAGEPLTFIRPDSGKCLHYYFYFMDAKLGLIYLRVPTWAPFRLQFYCNGHNWLARKLAANGIGYTMAPTTPSCGSTIGRVPKPWPTTAHRSSGIAHWIATPRAVVQSQKCSAGLPLEPDAGGIRHRPGVPLHRHPRPVV